jgi:polar amino acid transport system substrate-binding protein
MKKKNLFLVISLVVIIVIVSIVWFWYENTKIDDDSLTNIKDRGALIVGSNIPYGIMEFFNENNQPVGVDVDIAREIANRLGVKLEFNNYEWSDLFVKIKNDEIDLAISSITITNERQRDLLFSNPYFNGGQVIVIKRSNSDIKGVNSLADRRIATQQDTTGYDEAKKYTTKNIIFTYPDFNETPEGIAIINDLRIDKFEAIIVDYIQALNMVKNNPDLKIVGVPFTREDYGIATKIGNDSLIKKVNSILHDMQEDGTLDSIKTKWTKF